MQLASIDGGDLDLTILNISILPSDQCATEEQRVTGETWRKLRENFDEFAGGKMLLWRRLGLFVFAAKMPDFGGCQLYVRTRKFQLAAFGECGEHRCGMNRAAPRCSAEKQLRAKNASLHSSIINAAACRLSLDLYIR